jgi:CRP/FNR family cyclic AMP-dependent transcriptional regulator
MQEDLDTLRMVSILRDLDDAELTALRGAMVDHTYQPREQILQEGTQVTHFQIIFSGTVHIRRLAGKREMLMGRLGAGGFFGEINLFDPGLATASIYAMKPTSVSRISYEDFRAFMQATPAAGYKIVSAMMTEMARRLRQTSARFVQSVYWAAPVAGDV